MFFTNTIWTQISTFVQAQALLASFQSFLALLQIDIHRKRNTQQYDP